MCGKKIDGLSDTQTVSVLIVSFGDYTGLEQTIRSVIEQSYPISEIILSDDGSGKTYPNKILKLLKDAPCEVIVRMGTTNLGTTAHLNLIAKMAHSTYLKFMAAGDAFADNGALHDLIAFAQRCDSIVVSSNTAVCSQDLSRVLYKFPGTIRGKKLQRTGRDLFSVLAKKNIISAIGTLFQKRFFEEYGGFDEQYRFLEDWPIWLQISKNGGEIPFLNRVTCLHATGGISTRNGDAYHSPALKKDMIRCYECEILPNLKLVSRRTRREVQYRYKELMGSNEFLEIKFIDLYLRDAVKCWVKYANQRMRLLRLFLKNRYK